MTNRRAALIWAAIITVGLLVGLVVEHVRPTHEVCVDDVGPFESCHREVTP